jgi:beta-lactamase regulating signal transducer with metallopeptidase domain
MSDDLLHALTRASLQGGLFAAAVWLLCRLAPKLPPAARTALWWLAGLKLLAALVSPPSLMLPVLPAKTPPPERVTHVIPSGGETAAPLQSTATPRVEAPSLSIWIVAPWAAGVLALFAVAGWRVNDTRRLARMASPADDHTARAALALAGRLRLRRRPDVRVTDGIDTPQVTGIRRPVVLLPGSRFAALSDAERHMVLCHELLHLKRGDLWLGCVPAIAERLFFFHPLARLAAREYALAREAACDAEVLRVLGTPPQAYGRLLLRLGVFPTRAGFAAAGAPSTFSHLKRRLIMLDRHSASAATRRLGWMAAAAAACAIAPVQLVARPVAIEQVAPAAVAERAADVHPAAGPDDVAPAHVAAPPSHAAVRHDSSPAATRQPASKPSPRVKPASSRDLQWVLLRDGDQMSISGSSEHVDRARQRQKDGRPLLWVLRHGREYVITDPALIAQAVRIYEPLGQLGEKMGEIGARQGDIGRRMGEVGAKQGAIGARQGELGARQGSLGARQAALALQRLAKEQQEDAAAMAREEEALRSEMEKLNRQMDELSREMEAASQPMEDLGKEMEPLGRQMEALGRQMEEAAAKAEADMRALVDEAVSTGKATEPR